MHYVGTLASNGQVCFSYARARAQERWSCSGALALLHRCSAQRDLPCVKRDLLYAKRGLLGSSLRAGCVRQLPGRPPTAACWRPPRRVVTLCSPSGSYYINDISHTRARARAHTHTHVVLPDLVKRLNNISHSHPHRSSTRPIRATSPSDSPSALARSSDAPLARAPCQKRPTI